MKNIYILLLGVLPLVFTSCEVEPENYLIGKWELREKYVNNKPQYLDECDYDNGFRFKHGNNVTVYFGEPDAFNDCVIYKEFENWHSSAFDDQYIFISQEGIEQEYFFSIFKGHLTLKTTNSPKITYVLEKVY
jgi:hypothetical protein